MQLSLHADYALRVLVYLGTHGEQAARTHEISDAYGISKNHLVRVVQTLSREGYVRVQAGRSGGLALARKPSEIRLGRLVRATEPSLRLVECFDKATNTCPIASACALKRVLRDALESFLHTLDQHTLADVLENRSSLVQLLAARQPVR